MFGNIVNEEQEGDTSVLYNAISVDEKFFPHPPQGNKND